MEPCDDRWREELLDHALGLPAGAALAEHLENCAVCSDALREWRARSGQIDGGIRQLAASEPSSQTVMRVMAEVRTPRESKWSPVPKWAMVTLSGLVIAGAAFIYAWRARERRRQDEKALVAAEVIGRWKSPTQELLQSPTDRWFETPPRLGQYFYRLNVHTAGKESENP